MSDERAGPAIPGWLPLLTQVPALIFLTAVGLRYGLGYPALFDTMEPVFLQPVAEAAVFLSPVVAAALAALAVLRVRFRREGAGFSSTITFRLLPAHVVALALGTVIFAIFAAYVIAENVVIRAH